MFFQHLIALCIILIANTLNYYLTYNTTLVNPRFLLHIFLFHTLQGLFFWWMLLRFEGSLALQSQYSWRLYIREQLTRTLALSMVALSCIFFFSNVLAIPWLLPENTTDYLTLIIGMGMALQANQAFWQWKKQHVDTGIRKLNVQRGSDFFALPLTEVLIIEIHNGLVHVTSYSEQQYYADHSIREILALLSNEFFKVSPNLIIHYNSVIRYRESRSKGLVVQLWKQGSPSTMQLSGYKAKEFKQWYQSHQRAERYTLHTQKDLTT